MSPVDWSSLPPELMEGISRKLTTLADYIRFRAVCRACRSSTLPKPNHLPCQFPWLILPQSGYKRYRRAFFDLTNNKIHYLNLPELSYQYSRCFRGFSHRRFCGSSHGWFAIEEDCVSVFLFNPLIRERIDLPPLSFIKKIVLSGTPGSSFVALAVIIPMDVLAYYKSGEDSWKYIQETSHFTEDVTYFNGLFYAINKNGEIVVFDPSGDSPVIKFIHAPEPEPELEPELMLRVDRQYLVNSMGELLLVRRFLKFSDDFESEFPYKTSDFRLFKLDFARHKWEEMMSLGDMMLFVGNVSSLALKASDFPGCKGNKIYFLDYHFDSDYYNSVGDVGVFNLDDGSFDQLPCCLRNSDSKLLWPPLVWISPNPC